jgi:hypothetical protein
MNELEKIDSLVDLRMLSAFEDIIQSIVDDLEDENFRMGDVRTFLHLKLDNILYNQ